MCHGWLVHFAANNRFLVRYHGTMSPKQYIKHYQQQKRNLKNFSLKTTIKNCSPFQSSWHLTIRGSFLYSLCYFYLLFMF